MIQEVKAIMLRDLASLRQELEAYPDDASLWRVLPGTANPGGNLILHQMLVTLVAHLGYHLGQVNYHRRVLAAEPSGE